MEDSEDTERHN